MGVVKPAPRRRRAPRDIQSNARPAAARVVPRSTCPSRTKICPRSPPPDRSKRCATPRRSPASSVCCADLISARSPCKCQPASPSAQAIGSLSWPNNCIRWGRRERAPSQSPGKVTHEHHYPDHHPRRAPGARRRLGLLPPRAPTVGSHTSAARRAAPDRASIDRSRSKRQCLLSRCLAQSPFHSWHRNRGPARSFKSRAGPDRRLEAVADPNDQPSID
jgi:hypothetical protein